MNWPHLNDLNTTNYRIVSFTRLSVVVVALFMAAFFWELQRDDEAMAEKIMEAVLWYLAAGLALNTAQYASKRFSNTGYAQAKASAAPPQVTQTTGTVLQQSPGGPVSTGDTTTEVPAMAAPARTAAAGAAADENEWADGRAERGIL